MVSRDIIADIIERIWRAEQAAKQAMDETIRRRVEEEARALWGGDRHYVPQRGPRQEQGDRNSRIHRAYLQGVRLDEIARTERISTRRVLQIIKRK